jgi:hypothetical protein
MLRIGFLPSYAHYDTRFDSSGTVQPLGAALNLDSAGSNFLPLLAAAEAAVRDLTSDSSYRMVLGKVKLPLDADIRRFPLDLSLGITRWLTLTVRVPLVKTRVQGVFKLDSTTANVGWNQATQAALNSQNLSQILSLLSQLGTAIATLQTRIAQGNYGCPTSAQCQSANALLARAQRLLADLNAMTGPPGTSGLPPVAPLASSAAGLKIQAAIAAVESGFASFSVQPPTGTLPLPATMLGTTDVGTTILQNGEFGYGLLPLSTVRISGLGDVEARLRVGLLGGDRFRLVLTGGARLPTGFNRSPLHVFDLGTGDRQLDLEGGLEFAFEPGRVDLSGQALYTRQFADQVVMRWAPPERPIALITDQLLTDRKLGNVFRVAVYPSLVLSEGFRVYGSAYYWHKAADTYSPANGPPPTTASPADVARGTGGQSLSLGGGIAYRAARAQRDTTGAPTGLPVEAGLSYQAAFSGSGGLVPKSTMLNLYLRFYHRLW